MANFKKNDTGFICRHCGNKVLPLGYSSRDHCNKCLYSIHIDNNPGDRLNKCLGDLIPISAVPNSRKGFIIIYKCAKCGKIVKNIAAKDDDISTLIELTVVK